MSPSAEQYDKWGDELHALTERARELLAEADTYGDQVDLTAEGAVSDLRRHADYWLDCAAEARREGARCGR